MRSKTKIVQRVHGERAVRGGRRIELEFASGGEAVPGALLLPDSEAPAPAVLLQHGYSSRKEQMSDTLGLALLRRGVASLATDLPLHGTRADPVAAQASRNPLAIFSLWRQALAESSLALGFLRARAEVDAGATAVLGYSLGSYLAVQLAAGDAVLRAVVLAAGGDLPAGTPLAAIARRVADPLRAVRRLRGRPLLMVHGHNDRTVLPEQAERLFAAAAEPKEIRWWNSGHILPPEAVEWVADWLADRLGAP